MAKKILTFVNTENHGYFNNCEVIEKLRKAIENMEKDEKQYLITIEEIEEL